MIRPFTMDDLDAVMTLWQQTNIAAHEFIDNRYWHDNVELVKGMLPDATVFVYEDDHIIRGFIGLSGTYIAGIFVDTGSQSQGIGKALLDYVKETSPKLSLQVYQRNARAVQFYRREGFAVTSEQVDDKTGEIELFMQWNQDILSD